MYLTGYDNRLATITATANSSATGYGPERLRDPRLYYRTRTVTGTFTLILTWDLGSAVAIPIVAALGHNLLDDAEIRVEVSSVSNFATHVYDSGVIAAFDLSRPRPVAVTPPAGYPIIHIPASTPTARYLRLTLDDQSRASGYVELAHVTSGPLLDLDVQRGLALGSKVRLGMAGLRDWMLPMIVEEHDADDLRVIHEWSASSGGRLLLVPREDEDDSWQYQAIWGTASEERLDSGWIRGGAGADSKVELRFGLTEVSY